MAYNRKKHEQYQDTMARLFPVETPAVDENGVGVVSLARPITFQVVDSCNLKCTYCYQINKQHHIMDFEVAKKFIDLLLSYKTKEDNPYINCENTPAIIIEFIGGEPFLAIDLIDKISDYFEEQMILLNHPWATRHRFSICSNGVLYFDPRVQNYLRKHKNNLSFSISIDGNKALHDSARLFPDGSGSYDVAMAGVKDYIAKGGVMGSKITLSPYNITKTFDAVKDIIENGYEDININCVYEKGWTTEHAKILYSELKKLADYMIERSLPDDIRVAMFEENFFRPKAPEDNQNWCGGNAAMLSCDWKGDLYPCIRYMESSLGKDQKPIIIGNVNDGLVTKPEEEQCMKCMRAITRKSQSTEECFNCPIAEGCSWCTAYNYQEFGTVDHRATYICIMHKARSLANVYFWNKWYAKKKEQKYFKRYLPDNDALEIIDKQELELLNNLEKAQEKFPIINSIMGEFQLNKQQSNFDILNDTAK